LERVLAARGLSLTFTKPQQSTGSPRAMNSVMAGNHLTSIQTGSLVHVMIVNFSHSEIEYTKATVLGIAEATSASIVPHIVIRVVYCYLSCPGIIYVVVCTVCV
jgi:hypothetical protein